MVYCMHFSFYEKLCTYERFKSTYQTTEYNSYLNEYMSVFRTSIIFLIYMKILKVFFYSDEYRPVCTLITTSLPFYTYNFKTLKKFDNHFSLSNFKCYVLCSEEMQTLIKSYVISNIWVSIKLHVFTRPYQNMTNNKI